MKSLYDAVYATPVTAVTLDDNPGKLVQAGETLLWGIHICNTVAAVTYLQLFNKVALSGVTLGSTAPDAIIPVGTSLTQDVSFPVPVYFSLGLCAFSTAEPTGTTAAITHCTFLVS